MTALYARLNGLFTFLLVVVIELRWVVRILQGGGGGLEGEGDGGELRHFVSQIRDRMSLSALKAFRYTKLSRQHMVIT